MLNAHREGPTPPIQEQLGDDPSQGVIP
jgi:hypothetical protein